MKTLIQEGLQQLDMSKLDGYQIAHHAEITARKIITHIDKKKNKSGDGTNVKSSKKKSPVVPQPMPVTPEPSNTLLKIYLWNIKYKLNFPIYPNRNYRQRDTTWNPNNE